MKDGAEGKAQSRLKPIRVLAVDDSAVMRGVYRLVFESAADSRWCGRGRPIELCGTAEDGVACLAAVEELRPDVVVLDVEMPRMHGLAVLKRLREISPRLPVILCSSATETGARMTFQALALGAQDYVTKSGVWSSGAAGVETLREQLLAKVETLAMAGRNAESRARTGYGGTGAVADPDGSVSARVELVVSGLSTGGASALERILPSLPKQFPVPILIAQHMPRLFTRALAERLDRCCALPVREAYDGAEVCDGEVWLAPGDAHMEIVQQDFSSASQRRTLSVRREISRHVCAPSVDVLFRSASRACGAGTLALVMTGMGSDGRAGARRVYQAGGTVLAQDEATSVVWGMPGRVFDTGVVRRLLPLHAIAADLMACVSFGRSERFDVPKPPEREMAGVRTAGRLRGRAHGLYGS